MNKTIYKDISHLLAFTCQPERHDELLTLANEVMVKRLAKGISEQELNEYQQNVQRSLDIQQRSVQQLANTFGLRINREARRNAVCPRCLFTNINA